DSFRRSRGVPRQPLDACDDLPKQRPCQITFGELQGEVSGMPDQAPAGLEEPLLEARQRPTLNGGGEDEPTQEIAEGVVDDPEDQPDLVGPEPVAREARPVGGFFALLDPLLGRPALVVETDDRSVGPGERGDDEAYPREQFAEVMLDLGNHSARTIPGSRLVVEAPVADEWSVAGNHARDRTHARGRLVPLPVPRAVLDRVAGQGDLRRLHSVPQKLYFRSACPRSR